MIEPKSRKICSTPNIARYENKKSRESFCFIIDTGVVHLRTESDAFISDWSREYNANLVEGNLLNDGSCNYILIRFTNVAIKH